jgi:hypothetical protein
MPFLLAITQVLALAAGVAQSVDIRVYGRTAACGVGLLADLEVKPNIRDRLRANLFLGFGE